MEKAIEKKLNGFIHDLFLKNEYVKWRKNIGNYQPGIWHCLIVKLEAQQISLIEIKSLGEDINSKLVFNFVKAPDYNQTQEVMISFTVSGSMWHSLIWHGPIKGL